MTGRRRNDHTAKLYLYTAATIVIGLVAFVWSAATFKLDPMIALTIDKDDEGILLGLVFWILIGLLGGLRIERLNGYGVLTFHFPFIIAAMALGGPTAGAVVAAVSTIEARELRPAEVPWYGTLANHAALTFAAVAGGVTMVVARTALVDLRFDDAQAIELVAIIVGSLVFAVTATALVAGTIVLRDHLTVSGAIAVFDGAYRTTAASEVVLGWLLWLTYSVVGWWAALICAALVLVLWSSLIYQRLADLEPLTGLLRRAKFAERLNDARNATVNRGVIGALLVIDIDGFKRINDTHGHAFGDGVLVEIADRLMKAIRRYDSAGRPGGDEFEILLRNLPDFATAVLLAKRICDQLCQPMLIEGKTEHVGASIGVFVMEPEGTVPNVGRIRDIADRRMFYIKARGGGVQAEEPPLDVAIDGSGGRTGPVIRGFAAQGPVTAFLD